MNMPCIRSGVIQKEVLKRTAFNVLKAGFW